jgi:uncharacterized protein (TIGR02266 family)
MASMPNDDGKKKGEDKRTHPRVDFFSKVKVVVPDESTAIDVFAGNVSKGGMFLRSNRPLEKGKKVELEFEVENQPVKVEEGEVVWNKPFEPISIDGAPSGMGVEFRQMPEDSRNLIENFIDEALAAEPPATTPAESRAEPEKTPEEPEPAPVQQAPSPQPPPPAQTVRQSPARTSPAPARMKLGIPPQEDPAVQVAKPQEPQAAVPHETPRTMEENRMASLSTPPPRKKSFFLFGLFVLIVAVATFFILMMIMPSEESTGKKDTPKKSADTKGKDSSKAAVKAPVAPEPDKKADTPVEPDKKGEEPAKVDAKTAVPETGKPEEPESSSTPEAKSAAEERQVGMPVFSESSSGWRMVLKANGPVKTKNFTLKDPPRLAVDFLDSGYSGDSRTIDSPTPFISRVRVGLQEGYTRFVLDFEGKKIPKHKLVKGKDAVTVVFE